MSTDVTEVRSEPSENQKEVDLTLFPFRVD